MFYLVNTFFKDNHIRYISQKKVVNREDKKRYMTGLMLANGQ